MKSAAEEVKHYYEPEDDFVYDIGISADGTWRRRGFSSAYGVISDISLISVLVGGVKKRQRNLSTGGMVISTNAMLTLRAGQVQQMQPGM